ncbi:MAG TPA: hypothetical protein VF896_14740 [Anaerolineales bacterium]
MFFQTTTPDTSGYMIAGYAVAFILMALYVISIYIRARNLTQDRMLLEEMDKPAPPVEVSRPKKRPTKPVTKKSRKK